MCSAACLQVARSSVEIEHRVTARSRAYLTVVGNTEMIPSWYKNYMCVKHSGLILEVDANDDITLKPLLLLFSSDVVK